MLIKNCHSQIVEVSANHFDPGSFRTATAVLVNIYCFESELFIAGWTAVIFLEVINY